jgi:regulator of sirC expression with transglutaminase-like and TPR domain
MLLGKSTQISYSHFMRKILATVCLYIALSANLYANEALDDIRKALSYPENQIDLTIAKLTIDKIIDPSIDITQTEVQVNQAAAIIKTMFPANATSMDKLLAVRAFMFEKGAWNGFQVYRYNFDDPKGENLQNALISNLLKTRKGNCVSLPVMFVMLGQKVGLDVTLANAPLHLFVKFKETETGNVFNIEATTGANPFRDVWIIEQQKISPLAVETGIYLKPLTRKESAAELTISAATKYMREGNYAAAMGIADFILEYHSNSVNAMLTKGSAYSAMLNTELQKSGYPARPVSEDQKKHMDSLYENNLYWFHKAENLGWYEPSPQDEAEYDKTIATHKAKSR